MLDKTKSYTLLESDLLDRSLQQSLAVVYQNRVLNNPQLAGSFIWTYIFVNTVKRAES